MWESRVQQGVWASGLLEGVEPAYSLILFGHFLQDHWQIGKQGYYNGDEHHERKIVEMKRMLKDPYNILQ